MEYSTTVTSSSLDMSTLGSVITQYLGFMTVIYVLLIIAMWKIFTKAGKPGWASIVPIYNVIVMFQIIGLNPWLLLLYLIPVVNFVVAIIFSIMQASRLSKAFGKGTGFALGLFFLNPIFLLILGFGDSKYIGIQK